MAGFKLPKALLKVLFPKKKSSSSKSSSNRGGGGNIDELSPTPSSPPSVPTTATPTRRTKKQGGSSPSKARYDDSLKLCVDGPKSLAEEGNRASDSFSPVTVATTLASSSLSPPDDFLPGSEDGGRYINKSDEQRENNDGRILSFDDAISSIANANEVINNHQDKDKKENGQQEESSVAAPGSTSSETSAFDAVDKMKPTRKKKNEQPQASTIPSAASEDATVQTEDAVQDSTTGHQPVVQPAQTQTKKVQFAIQREETRQRASLARQKRILSKAALRLGAISDTSLENIEEASIYNSKNKVASSDNEDHNGKSSSIKSVVSHKVLSEGEGGVSSIVFYESSPTRQKQLDAREKTNSELGAEQETAKQEGKDDGASPGEIEDHEQEVPGQVLSEVPVSDDKTARQNSDQGDGNTKNNIGIQFFILLLCPTSRIFELVEVTNVSPHSTINDILNVIPQHCTDQRLLQQKYVGFVRPSDRMEFVELDKRAFSFQTTAVMMEDDQRTQFCQKLAREQKKHGQYEEGHQGHQDKEKSGDGSLVGEHEDFPMSLNVIHEDDVLVAILEGYSGYQMGNISKPILRNSKFREMIRRRSSKRSNKSSSHGRHRKSGSGGGGSKHHLDGDGNQSTRSSKSRSSRRKRHSHGGGSISRKKSGGSVSSRSSRRRRYSSTSSSVPVEEIGGKKKGNNRNSMISNISYDNTSKANGNRSSPAERRSEDNNVKDRNNEQRFSSLCQKLENLSKKLQNVDDEIVMASCDDASVVTSETLTRPGVASNITSIKEEEVVVVSADTGNATTEDVVAIGVHGASRSNNNFKMTPKMVAYELAANIEDIFADHDVEIMAVDAAEAGDEDSDDDTFVSARSRRSIRSLRSVRDLVMGFDIGQGPNDRPVSDKGGVIENRSSMPLFEITTKKKRERKPRKNNFDMFGEEDDMMLQIEAMARQADAAFESRNSNGRTAGTAIIEPMIGAIVEDIVNDGMKDVEENADVTDLYDVSTPEVETKEDVYGNNRNEEVVIDTSSPSSVDEEINGTSDDILCAMKSGSIISTVEEGTAHSSYTTHTTLSQHDDALSQNFLNTSTSMVSTMVAASQGRINEVHVLQYLGVTIVCLMQQNHQRTTPGGGGLNNPSSFGAKEVLQSAMFLAFMVNGQRYLAKVTKK